jgi:hypothetical protein
VIKEGDKRLLSWKEKYGDTAVEHQERFKATMRDWYQTVDWSYMKEVNGRKRAELNRANKGKTLDEIYGKECAAEIRQKLSDSRQGENNPAYGNVYFNGGKSVKGHYKGHFFRSLLEYSFMKHLEGMGFSLDVDVDYECFTIPYVLDGRNRTYRIDFFVKPENVAYEVKPSYVVNKPGTLQEAKWQAAIDHFGQLGIKFRVVSELDFQKIKFDVARQDRDVIWKEETFKYFRRTEP